MQPLSARVAPMILTPTDVTFARDPNDSSGKDPLQAVFEYVARFTKLTNDLTTGHTMSMAYGAVELPAPYDRRYRTMVFASLSGCGMGPDFFVMRLVGPLQGDLRGYVAVEVIKQTPIVLGLFVCAKGNWSIPAVITGIQVALVNAGV